MQAQTRRGVGKLSQRHHTFKLQFMLQGLWGCFGSQLFPKQISRSPEICDFTYILLVNSPLHNLAKISLLLEAKIHISEGSDKAYN